MDRDGLVDVLEGTYSFGSGFSSTEVQLTLGGSGRKLQAEEGFAFGGMTAVNQVPKELLDRRHRDALEWIEEALFQRICAIPDPSLAWLLDRTKRLTWIEGPPQMPDNYVIRLPARRIAGLSLEAYMPVENLGGKIDPDGEVWLFYAGRYHAIKATNPVQLARKGNRVLLGTAHGVILTNPKQSRYAWIYVSEGCNEGGMFRRFNPCIVRADIQGDTAIITVLKLSVDGDEAKRVQVRVNLNTGAVSK